MANILIRGMEMPKRGNPLTVLIYPDGTATWKDNEYKAVEQGGIRMTNADKIRAMTDEELSIMFVRMMECYNCPFDSEETDCAESGDSSKEMWLNWLRKEWKTDGMESN